MKFSKIFAKKNKKSKGVLGFYQDAIEKNGRDQILKIVDRGLSLPIFIL